jgi:hypothetical protein
MATGSSHRALVCCAATHAAYPLVNTPPRAGVPAVLPLAVLEALRASDIPQPDALDEQHADLSAKRFGLNPTVEVQIERLERQVRRREAVPGQEFAALARLVMRRPDAGVVFSDAGRRAARREVQGRRGPMPVLRRLLPRPWAHVLGFRVARRVARGTFGTELERSGGAPRAVLGATLAVVTEPGPACSFVGSALAELLRQLAGFDGAMVHTACRGRGAETCMWSAASPTPRR